MAEGSGKRRFFPEAFKLEAVAAVRGGRSVSQVAAELGLPDRLVRSWLRWVALPHFHGHCYAADAAVWNVAAFCSGVR